MISLLEGNDVTENLNEEDVDVHDVEENVDQAQGVGGVYHLMEEATDDSDYASDYDDFSDDEEERVFNIIDKY